MITSLIGMLGVGVEHYQNSGVIHCSTDRKIRELGQAFCSTRVWNSAHGGVQRTCSPLKLLWWASLLVGARGKLTDPFPAQFELSSLDGSIGFIINGQASGDQSGYSVSSAGDVNGDGLGDILIGADNADVSSKSYAGKSFLVFGRKTNVIGGTLELSSLNGMNGIFLNGEDAGDECGNTVSSAGDVNGDGLSDIVIGAHKATASGKSDAGKSYVLYGRRNLMSSSSTFELSSLDGTSGYILNGETEDDRSGYSVSSAGDVNGDGLSDIVIGASNASPSGRSLAGKSYVVFGRRELVAGGALNLSSLDGGNGYILNGESEDDRSGNSVSSAGDVNGDGLSDIVIGAYHADHSGKARVGKSYVVFGSRSTLSGGILDLSSLNGSNGFIITGEASVDRSGISVSSAGDVNGDGLSDLVIGAYYANPLGKTNAGKSYVVFGRRSVISGGNLNLSSLNGSNGFILHGEAKDDRSGFSVSSAGDVNGDGLADLLIGAYHATPSDTREAGKSYVVFGSRKVVSGGILELSNLDGSNGFILNGEDVNDECGNSVSSAGDMNGDGIADLVLGAFQAAPSGRLQAGKSYVIFGRNYLRSTLSSALSADTPSSQPMAPQSTTVLTSKKVDPFSTQTSPESRTLRQSSSSLLAQSLASDSTPLIAGIVAAVAALACCLLTGGAFFYRKRSINPEHAGKTHLENQESLSGSVSNPAGQQGAQLIPGLTQGHEYGQLPPIDDYDKVIIEDYNKNTYQMVNETINNPENDYDSPSSPLE